MATRAEGVSLPLLIHLVAANNKKIGNRGVAKRELSLIFSEPYEGLP